LRVIDSCKHLTVSTSGSMPPQMCWPFQPGSLSLIQNQARRARHPLESEVQLLVIHGVLHLLGHDHANVQDKSRMWAAQVEVLRTLGLPDLVVSET
jgi:Endoribonuclease YbeY